MNLPDRKQRFLNADLTSRLIALHTLGYDQDFHFEHGQMFCSQNDQPYSALQLVIRVIDQGYDQLENCYKYVHTIDTCCGLKGILITQSILTLAQPVNNGH